MMSDTSLKTGTTYSPHSAGEACLAENRAQQVVLLPPNLSRECMIASEQSLWSIWMTPEEDEAWADL